MKKVRTLGQLFLQLLMLVDVNVIVDNLYDDSRQMHFTSDIWFEKFYKQAIDLV